MHATDVGFMLVCTGGPDIGTLYFVFVEEGSDSHTRKLSQRTFAAITETTNLLTSIVCVVDHICTGAWDIDESYQLHMT